ncbi:hypothetical protein H4217_003547 [Coemansia sp. RSA 1939]|nr:hypothetical protein H4217_003547 [Coemansia sp. RSA 1939]KAJ2598795.1 hypothetical protein EV177_007458 [Coemansia sp. RSA 1804]
MHSEIENAAGFWLKYIPDSTVGAERKEALREALMAVLRERYAGHWDVDQTAVGSGYRSVSNWRGVDGALAEAAGRARVPVAVLERLLPRDVVVWCDPHSVTYRVGDHGTVYTVYEDKRGLLESMKKTMAEKAAKSNGDFVISAYTTPVVIRSADGVEIVARRGGASAPAAAGGGGGGGVGMGAHVFQASPTKGAADLRRNAMSPLRHVSTLQTGAASASVSAAAPPPSLPPPPRWSPPSAPAS